MPSLHLPICPPPSQFVASTDLCTGCIVLPFLEHQPVGIMQYGAFSGWPLSFGNTRLNILWVYSWPVSTSLFIAQWHATVWMDHSLFTPTEGHLGHFQVLANKNKVVINICMPVCVDINVQVIWINTKECDCWMVRYVWFCWKLPVFQEKAMAPHSNTLASKIPWTEEPGRLQSIGSVRVGHDSVTSLSRIGENNGNPLQGSCLENPRDGGAWSAAVYGVAQSQTRLRWLSSSSNQSSKVAVPFCIPTSNVWEFLWLHVFVSIWCCQRFGF